jgi:chromosome segregation ATPase
VIYNNEKNMVDKNTLSKGIEEQIQGLASDVYIQVEEKLTQLITSVVATEMSKNKEHQNKTLTEKEQSLNKDFVQKDQAHQSEVTNLKQALTEKDLDAKTAQQNFQVELTQNTINYTETIKQLENKVANLTKTTTEQHNSQQSGNNKLSKTLQNTEQNLADKTKEIIKLQDQVSALMNKELALNAELTLVNEQSLSHQTQLSEAVLAAKEQANIDAKEEIESLVKKNQTLVETHTQIQADMQKNSDEAIQAVELTITEHVSQVQKEQQSKAELQQQLSAQQKIVDTAQDKIIRIEQECKDYQLSITKFTEQAELAKKAHQDELKAINDAGEEAKQLQTAAQQNIIELEKAKTSLEQQVATEQQDVKLYQKEVTVLAEQLKVAQEGQDNILERFNSNREKQEIENTKVRETIKFLRDENHDLLTAKSVETTEYTDKINELEHKLTEYRLKFEYAQKQLAN